MKGGFDHHFSNQPLRSLELSIGTYLDNSRRPQSIDVDPGSLKGLFYQSFPARVVCWLAFVVAISWAMKMAIAKANLEVARARNDG